MPVDHRVHLRCVHQAQDKLYSASRRQTSGKTHVHPETGLFPEIHTTLSVQPVFSRRFRKPAIVIGHT